MLAALGAAMIAGRGALAWTRVLDDCARVMELPWLGVRWRPRMLLGRAAPKSTRQRCGEAGERGAGERGGREMEGGRLRGGRERMGGGAVKAADDFAKAG